MATVCVEAILGSLKLGRLSFFNPKIKFASRNDRVVCWILHKVSIHFVFSLIALPVRAVYFESSSENFTGK